MSLSYTIQRCCVRRKDAIGFEPIAGVPPAAHLSTRSCRTGGTPNPLPRRGSEFNQLAPHTPGRLEAPRTGARRQHRGCRSPPTLKGMAQHASPHPAPHETEQRHVFRSISNANEGKMSDRNKEYPRRLSVQITDAMDDRLEQVARGRDEAKAEVVRAALRAFLDEQEDMIGSRKHFTKAFGRRIDQVERVVAIGIWLNLQTLQMLTERLHKETVDVSNLLANSVGQGVELQAWIEELIEIALREKTKPPA